MKLVKVPYCYAKECVIRNVELDIGGCNNSCNNSIGCKYIDITFYVDKDSRNDGKMDFGIEKWNRGVVIFYWDGMKFEINPKEFNFDDFIDYVVDKDFEKFEKMCIEFAKEVLRNGVVVEEGFNYGAIKNGKVIRDKNGNEVIVWKMKEYDENVDAILEYDMVTLPYYIAWRKDEIGGE